MYRKYKQKQPHVYSFRLRYVRRTITKRYFSKYVDTTSFKLRVFIYLYMLVIERTRTIYKIREGWWWCWWWWQIKVFSYYVHNIVTIIDMWCVQCESSYCIYIQHLHVHRYFVLVRTNGHTDKNGYTFTLGIQ